MIRAKLFRIARILPCFMIPLLCCIGFFPGLSGAGDLGNWQWRNPPPQGNVLNEVAYGDGVFVAVGNAGTIITSADGGATWTLRPSGTIHPLYGITCGNGIFVAVGDHGTVTTSFDGGNTWTPKVVGSMKCLGGVVYANNTFIVVGEDQVVTSEDGLNWTSNSQTIESHIFHVQKITFGNGIYVAFGQGGVYTSTDLATWKFNDFFPNDLLGMTYGGGTFVLFGRGGRLLTSSDGENWISRVSSTTVDLHGGSYGNGMFLVVGDSGMVITSSHGETWALGSIAKDTPFHGAVCGNGTFVVVGGGGGIFTSVDNGTTWNMSLPRSTILSLEGIASGGGKLVAVGERGKVFVSSDGGESWAQNSVKKGFDIRKVAYGKGMFVAVGWGSPFPSVVTSPDGMNWTQRKIKSPGNPGIVLFDITYGNGTFVAVGNWGIATSPNGKTWKFKRILPVLDSELYAVTYGNGMFVAVGWDAGNNPILTSPDGVKWTRRIAGTGSNLNGVIYGNGTFVAVGSRATVVTSRDGVAWSARYLPESLVDEQANLKGVAYGDGSFVAVTGFRRFEDHDPGAIITSPDGIDWTRRISNTTNNLNAVTYVDGTFVAVGEWGTIIQSKAPDLSVGPSSADFAGICVGSLSAGRTITVSNVGASDLGLATVTFSGAASAEFDVQGDACSETVLPPGGACVLEVVFSPSSTGSKNANLVIPYSADPFSDPQARTILLSGNGVDRLALASPNGDEVIPAGTAFTIRWGAPAGVVKFNLFLSTDNGLAWKLINDDPVEGASFNWAVPALRRSRRSCLIRIVGYNASNAAVQKDRSDKPFTIEVAR